MTLPTTRPATKQPPVHAPNAALLIDFDNVTMGIRSDLQVELRRLMSSEIIRGKVAVQRAYADWRRYPQYIVPLSEASIDLIFAPAFGSNKKNATDIRLAIDALELIFTRPEIGTFILLSGDSDFSSLVIKLKEYGKYVIGVGIRESSSDLLIQNCDEYYSYNELAGLTRVGDEQTEHRDPWELVVDAVLEMKKRGDVMRSDRLKQVMQELDPSFDEKNIGMNRFSKFVDEAKRRGLITATKLENGQFEIDLGSSAPGGEKALPAIPGDADERRERERAERGAEERSGERGRRGRRGGRGRGGRAEGERAAEGAPAAGTLSLAEAFELLKRVLRELGALTPKTVGEDEVRARMTEIHGKADDPLFHRPRFGRFLRQAHDASIVDLSKNERGFEMSLRPEVAAAAPAAAEPAPPEEPARGRRARGRGGRGAARGAQAPAPSVAAPAAASVTEAPAAGAVPAAAVAAGPKRGILYRRGRKGSPAEAAQIPLVGMVDMGEAPTPAPAAKAKRAKPAPRRGGHRGGKKKGTSSEE
ncbi:MAG: NYN domain-containing protein [Gemmatimonadetes bacterium]|nr:NYN domain-containing protein [Gemmatimonadota bacterium]